MNIIDVMRQVALIKDKVDKDGDKVLSDVNYSKEDAAKVSGIPEHPEYTDTLYDDTAVRDLIKNLSDNKADKTYVDGKISGVYHFKGSCLFSELPTVDSENPPSIGDTWNVTDKLGMNYTWTGGIWDENGTNVDLSSYQTNDQADAKYEPKDSTIVKDANYIHTDNNFTTEEKNKLASLENYQLPDTLPASMIESDDQRNFVSTQQINKWNAMAEGGGSGSGYDDSEIRELINGKSDEGHTHTKDEIGLSNVDNTADIDKPISTATQQALDNKADKTYVDGKISGVYHFKGSVPNEASLPTDNLTEGDVYNLEDSGMNVAWTGEETGWDMLGVNVDLSAYQTSEQADAKYEPKDSTIVKDANYVHTDNNFTTEEKEKLESITAYDDTTIKSNIRDLQQGKASNNFTYMYTYNITESDFTSSEGLYTATINHGDDFTSTTLIGVLYDENKNEEFCSINIVDDSTVQIVATRSLNGTLILNNSCGYEPKQ